MGTDARPEEGDPMVRKLGLRTFAFAALLGGGTAVLEIVYRTMHLHW